MNVVCRFSLGKCDADYDTLGSVSAFLSKVLNFMGIAISLYIVARTYGWASNDSIIKPQVRCKFCRKYISQKVSCVGVRCR